MRLLGLYIFLIFFSFTSMGQTLVGKTIDQSQSPLPFVQITNQQTGTKTQSKLDGHFSISVNSGDTLLLHAMGYDTLIIQVTQNMLDAKHPVELLLIEKYREVAEVQIMHKRLADFDVGYLPPVKGVQIYTGTNAVIELANQSGAKSTGNPRELFAKIPGLNIWESDGAGIQMGIGGRGLSPNRTANFNTRQNGYDISADALGYPESYYTPPIEALESIEIIRGSAALQFGTQFGGLLNFILKNPPAHTPFEFTTRQTGGLYGYYGSFNRVAGSTKRWSYQAYHQYKRGDGYRKNSAFEQHQAFAQVGYRLTEKAQVRLEYTHMNYLAQQPGGLSDLQYEADHRQSFRDRNWFKVNWNLLALHLDIDLSSKASLNFRAFGMLSSRETLGFLGKITQSDPGLEREMIQGLFKNAGAEFRFLRKYALTKRTDKPTIHGAFLAGARYYRGSTIANQGIATTGDRPDFSFRRPNDLENSSYSYPSENAAAFLENILFLGERVTMNIGVRFEYIKSGSTGYYKQYVIHPLNFDTLNVFTNRDTNEVVRALPLFGAGLSFKLAKNHNLYLNGTQNYRAINFTDIRVNNPNVIIDPNIQDEYGFTAELGARGIVSDYFIYDVAGFYIFYGNKIGLAPKSGTLFKERTNIGNAQNIGVESFAELDFLKAFRVNGGHGLSLFINAAYIHTEYISSKEPNYIGKQVEYVSPVIIRSGIKYAYKGFTFQVQGNYNSAQFADASNAVIPSGDAVIGLVPSYFVMDLSTRYAFRNMLQLEIGVTNLTNEKYFTRRATGYPGPGILPADGIFGYFTLQYKFTAKRK
jgi:Fe(3+) dicitrate transport protein